MDFNVFSSVKLKALQLDIPKNLFWRWHDDGKVSSVKDHTLHLAERYCVDIPLLHHLRNSQGTVAIITGPITHYHKYFMSTGSPELDVMVDAHEETHFLDYVERLNLLDNAISRREGSKVDFSKVKDHEVRANIGAIYALISRGVDLDLVVSRIRTPYRNTFTKAIEAYFD